MAADPAPIIRPAVHADMRVVGEMGARLVETHHRFDERRFIAADRRTPAAYAAFLDSQIDRAEAMILVAEVSGTVVGYAFGAIEGFDYMSLRGPAGVLHDLFVAPAHRHRGVGRMLLHAALAYFTSHGVARVVLSTADKNEAAQRLFAAAGFRRTMVEMTRELDS